MKKTLKQLITSHDNNYNFEVKEVISLDFAELPTLSVVIPYWENFLTINLLLENLYNGLTKIEKYDIKWDFEVIIVDDGSLYNTASKIINKQNFQNLKILKNTHNKGRTHTRNQGLWHSTKELVLFMDADILVDEQLILNNLKIHSFMKQRNKKGISVGFFDFQNNIDFWLKKSTIHMEDIHLNDFRIDCIYHKTWVGCNSDKQFIGKHFKILEQTDMFKKWPKGFFGPWLLPNMVLGGFFMVDAKASKDVKGFDKNFVGYGFTETSLPTKLIAKYNYFVIPVPFNGCVHINDNKISLVKEEKDKIFQEKHKYYFNHYLNLTLKQVL